MDKPSFGRKLSFWIVLGILSTYFAEVLSGSQPFVFFIEFGYVGIIPLYALHTLVLSALAIRPKRPFSIRTLYLFSNLFGMYEAYITKVLWEPPWNPDEFKIGGVAVLSSLMLVPFWHAYMSFLAPLFTAENLLADSTSLVNSLSEKIRRLVYRPFFPAVVGAYGGIMLGINLPDAQQAVTSAILNTAVVTILIVIWTLLKGKRHYHLADLLPGPTATFILGILLLSYYIYFGLNLRIEALPSISQQVTVWLIYVFLIALIIRSVHKDKLAAQKHQQPIANVELSPLFRLRFKHWLFFTAGFIFSAPAVNLLPDIIRLLFTAVAFYGGMAFGVVTFIVTIYGLFHKKRPV